MSEEEILQLFKERYINSKNNNFIFTEVNDFSIIDKIPDICSISCTANEINIPFARNIKIDLDKVFVKYILTESLEFLQKVSNLDFSMELKDKFSLLKYQGILRRYEAVNQLIFYNVESLSKEDQMLFNEIYYFGSPFFNANTFIKDRNFSNYFLTENRVLDNRENYTRIRTIDFL